MNTIWLDFYGVRARVDCACPDVAGRVREDLLYFISDESAGPANVTIEARREDPDYDSLPALTATLHTPRNICFSNGAVTYLDYFGRALGRYHRDEQRFEVSTSSAHLLHEIVYLTLLSRVGEQLERRGMHRLHSLAMGVEGQGALFMMDSGGGKSSLALGLLKQAKELELISEDSPLITRRGGVLPFPLRLGVLGPPPPHIPPEYIYYTERMEFEPKHLISLRAFEGSIARGEFMPRLLFIGTRRLSGDCVVRETGRWQGFKALVRHMVVGVGLYQGVEFLLRTSPLELIRSSRLFFSRLVAAVRLLGRTRVYVLELGRDLEHNATIVREFLERQRLGRSS